MEISLKSFYFCITLFGFNINSTNIYKTENYINQRYTIDLCNNKIKINNNNNQLYLGLEEKHKPYKITLSENSKHLAYCIDKDIRLINIENKTCFTINTNDLIKCLSFSFDKNYLIYHCLDGSVNLYNIITKEIKILFYYNIDFIDWDHIKEIRMTSNNSFLVYLTDSNQVGIYEVNFNNTQEFKTLNLKELNQISSIDCCKYIAIAFKNNKLKVISLNNNVILTKEFKFNLKKIRWWSNTDLKLYCQDGTIKHFDIKTNKII